MREAARADGRSALVPIQTVRLLLNRVSCVSCSLAREVSKAAKASKTSDDDARVLKEFVSKSIDVPTFQLFLQDESPVQTNAVTVRRFFLYQKLGLLQLCFLPFCYALNAVTLNFGT